MRNTLELAPAGPGMPGPYHWTEGGPVSLARGWLPKGLAGKPMYVFETGGSTYASSATPSPPALASSSPRKSQPAPPRAEGEGPFKRLILRGVTLAGINSVTQPKARRIEAWDRLTKDLDFALLPLISHEIGLGEAIDAAPKLLAGQLRGRVLVDVNR